MAVVGLGVGAAHAWAYAADPRCELRWLCDLDGERAGALAAELGAGAPTGSFDEVIADPEVALVSIASYDDAHFEQALAALEAGKHVFAEKPLCRTVAELRALREAWSSRPGLHVGSNLVLRSAPLYRWLRERLLAGELGRIYAFDGDYLYGRLHKITGGWRKDVPDYSVLLGGGIHLVDLMLWLTGERPVRVAAAGNRIATEETSFRYQDFAAATFEFSSTLVGRITANFASVHPHQHVVRVFGTEAAFLYDDAGARLHRSRDPENGAEALDLAPVPALKAELLPDFVGAILAGDDVRQATQHELDVIGACVGAQRALSEGGTLDIEYA